jgi:hypothetical protein
MKNYLQQALNFTEEDLRANRDGELSAEQRIKLEISRRGSLRVLWIMTAIALLSVAIGFFQGGMGAIGFGSIALLLAILGLVEYLTTYRAFQHDLTLAKIETAQGVIDYLRSGGSNLLDTELRPSGIRLGDMKFLLMEDQAMTFEDGEVYILYYAPATQRLLSAERAFVQEDIDEGEILYYEETALDEMNQQGFIGE